VNHQLYSFLALSLAQERAAEADRYRRWTAAQKSNPSSPSVVRQSLARMVATFSRSSAWIVRRLDSCIADDLGRSLAPTE
jgi:hypothetical protein